MIGCSYPPIYDGIGADEYMEWEIAIDNIFATCFICPSSYKFLTNASSGRYNRWLVRDTYEVVVPRLQGPFFYTDLKYICGAWEA